MTFIQHFQPFNYLYSVGVILPLCYWMVYSECSRRERETPSLIQAIMDLGIMLLSKSFPLKILNNSTEKITLLFKLPLELGYYPYSWDAYFETNPL